MLLKIQKKNKMSENNSSQIEIKKKDVIEGLGISIQGSTTPEKIGLLRGQFLKLTNHLHILNGDCYNHSYKTFMLKKYFDSNLESFTEIIIYSNFYAIDIHKGSYGNLLQSQDKIFKNIKDNGFKKMNLPVVHRFMNDPRKTVSQDLRTEIWVPIIKKA